MIISRTPFRISFCGGGTDFKSHYIKYGGCVVSASIDKYVYVTVSDSFDGSAIRLGYSKNETVKDPSEIQHPIFREVLCKYSARGVEFNSISDIPSGTGLGSSSSFTVGLLNALHRRNGEETTPRMLAEEACEVEIDRLGKDIGVQDQYAAAFGGLNFLDFRKDGTVVVEPIKLSRGTMEELSNSLMMFYLGGIRKAENVTGTYSGDGGSLAAKKNTLTELARGLRDELEQGDVSAVGRYIDKGWEIKRALSRAVSNPTIDEAYAAAKGAGAVGGKLLGAGGNGFMLLYADEKRRDAVRSAMSKFREFRFSLGRAGTEIVYSDRFIVEAKGLPDDVKRNPPRVSVIVPVYDASETIGRCAEQLKSQTFRDFEAVFVVDSRSADDSLSVARRISERTPELRVLEQTDNAGAGGARNIGIDGTDGEFIAFLDVDDCIHPHFLETMVDMMDGTGCDISVCNFYYSRRPECGPAEFHGRKPSVMSGGDAILELGRGGISANVWDKMFRRSAVESAGLRFGSGLCEDYRFVMDAFYGCGAVARTDIPLYNYVVSKNGRSWSGRDAVPREDLAVAKAASAKFSEERPEDYGAFRSATLEHILVSMTLAKWPEYRRLSDDEWIVEAASDYEGSSTVVKLYGASKTLFYIAGKMCRAVSSLKRRRRFQRRTAPVQTDFFRIFA